MKKFLASLCVVALVLGLGASTLAAVVDYGAELDPNEKTYTQTFRDVPENHWCFKMIEDLVERGAINGFPDGNFYPNNTVTRQEFAKIMVVAAKEPVYPASNVSFSDVPLTHWANPFIEAAKPYMTAYQDRQGNQTFKPEAGALREDMAVAVVKLRGYDARLADLSMLTTMFSDVDSISVSARPYVALAVENGIISGYPGQNGQKGTFGAQRTITRCEAAAILWRAFQYGSDEKVIPGDQPDQPAASDPVNTPEPTKPAQPSPSPKPTLPTEPAEPEKPYVAEQLARATVDEQGQHITMDEDDNIIFYDSKKEQILSLNPNTKDTQTLLDTKTATCAVNGTTYTDLDVEQVFWDNVAHRLLVVGELEALASDSGEDGWETSGGDGSCSGIFTLVDGELTYTFDYDPSQYDYIIVCALQNGNYVCRTVDWDGRHNYESVMIYDLENQSQVQKLEYASIDMIAPNGQNLYAIGTSYYSEYGGSGIFLYKYNYGSSSWEILNMIGGNNVNCNHMATCRDGLFYLWDKDGVKAVRPSDAAKQKKFDPEEDVEVLDMNALPNAYTIDPWENHFFVTSDEQFIFYDENASAFRVIRKTPNA